MLYLIKDRDYLKIGYTQDINNRWKNYKLHNCYVELLYTKPGSRVDEKEIHKLCNKYLYKGEWYHYCDEVIEIFNTFESKIIKDIIWFKSFVVQNAINILSNKILQIPHKKQIKAKRFIESISFCPDLNSEYNLNIWIYYYKEQIKYLNTIHLFTSNCVQSGLLDKNEYLILFNKSIKVTDSIYCKTFINNTHEQHIKKQKYIDTAFNLIRQIKKLLQLDNSYEFYDIISSLLKQAEDASIFAEQIYIPIETMQAFDILLEWSQMKFSREL